MAIDWQVVPIQTWPVTQTKVRRHHPFHTRGESGSRRTRGPQSIDWSGTVDLLERELRHLAARNVLLQMAVDRKDIRQDGWIRATARPAHPGVILTFDSRYGHQSYPCDTFTDWRANVRAIAVAVEDLRRIDRYGVSRRGEQYRGFLQLPTGRDALVARGRELIRQYGGETAAIKATHPDHGGNANDFQAVQAARGRV